jgi:hypothetical protein
MLTSMKSSRLLGRDFSMLILFRKQEGKAESKSTLTKEEKIQKAKELQEAIRKKRLADEKKLAEE